MVSKYLQKMYLWEISTSCIFMFKNLNDGSFLNHKLFLRRSSVLVISFAFFLSAALSSYFFFSSERMLETRFRTEYALHGLITFDELNVSFANILSKESTFYEWKQSEGDSEISMNPFSANNTLGQSRSVYDVFADSSLLETKGLVTVSSKDVKKINALGAYLTFAMGVTENNFKKIVLDAVKELKRIEVNSESPMTQANILELSKWTQFQKISFGEKRFRVVRIDAIKTATLLVTLSSVFGFFIGVGLVLLSENFFRKKSRGCPVGY